MKKESENQIEIERQRQESYHAVRAGMRKTIVLAPVSWIMKKLDK